MSLTTPSNIRELQIKLYRKAKNEPGYRFYLLYDKIYREDILSHAYKMARANKGAPGVDGQSFEDIESVGLETWLTGIREELRNKTYRPQPVRRVKIPKPGGGERPLGIPCIFCRHFSPQQTAWQTFDWIWTDKPQPGLYIFQAVIQDRHGAQLGLAQTWTDHLCVAQRR